MELPCGGVTFWRRPCSHVPWLRGQPTTGREQNIIFPIKTAFIIISASVVHHKDNSVKGAWLTFPPCCTAVWSYSSFQAASPPFFHFFSSSFHLHPSSTSPLCTSISPSITPYLTSPRAPSHQVFPFPLSSLHLYLLCLPFPPPSTFHFHSSLAKIYTHLSFKKPGNQARYPASNIH